MVVLMKLETTMVVMMKRYKENNEAEKGNNDIGDRRNDKTDDDSCGRNLGDDRKQ